MFALVAAILFFLRALGVDSDSVDLMILGFAFWALHFFWNPLPMGTVFVRRDN
jgi:hypothetical protein